MRLRKNLKKFGDLGESIATDLLVKKGYKIIAKNFRSKFGEIDIVANCGDTLVFVEVKTRWSRKFGKPEEAVIPRKLYRIKKAAEYYCLLNNVDLNNIKARIDVVAIEIENGQVTSAKIIEVD